MKNLNIAVALSAAFAALVPFAASSSDGSHVPEYLKRAVAYQLSLRTFTRDGNFRAAAAMLEHVRSVGVDIVYLTPFAAMPARGAVAFVRRHDGEAVFVAANLKGAPVEFKADGVAPKPGAKPLMADRGELGADGMCRLGAWGHVVVPSNP